MRKNVFYIIATIFILQICYFLWHPKPVSVEKAQLPLLSLSDLPDSMRGLTLKPGKYSHLLGWHDRSANFKNSLHAFQNSCDTFLRQNPETFVGSQYIHLKAKDWYPACRAALKASLSSEKEARSFFEHWFLPVEFKHDRPVKGLFTGYYVPTVQGSLNKSPEYQVPIYSLPTNLVRCNLRDFKASPVNKTIVGRLVDNRMVPFYTRKEIDEGAIVNTAPLIAWVGSELDRLTIEIEGSGVINLENNNNLVIGFSGTNGGEYRSVASILIKQNLIRENDASMENIIKFFKSYPDKLRDIINQNKSFVFFRKLPKDKVVGSQGVPLTAGYSLAVDRKWIPMGMPLWLTTKMYDPLKKKEKYLDRLMIAQDAGGSIKGMVRGDIYFGEGRSAKETAVRMKHSGHYWLLLPRMDRKLDSDDS
ncbi:MAG: MltA domain-containing protein [Legionellaceae bacterium]|nr:MltA domain-containing protein [Legionellaceae bacterium]